MISLNVAISFYRKTYRIDTNKTELNSEIESDNNEEDISKSDNINALYQYIDELNEINKALMLLYLDQYNYKEIAYALGISETNVATKISRIKEQLKKRFK